MRTETVCIYKYSELSDSAKAKARDWWKECMDDWWDCTYEDFIRVFEIIGISVSTRPVQLMSGKTRQDPCIYFNLSYSQGDGASFAGYYYYGKNSCKKIREYCNDSTLFEITDRLAEIQKKNFYKVSCKINAHRDNGVSIESDWSFDINKEIQSCMDNLCKWMYRQLQENYEYLTSDEAVAESIECNEYEFYGDGSIA